MREVFHAARNRAEAAREAADGLASLPAFTTWGGDAADAARQAIGKTRMDLDSHGDEALAVARAADQAADGIADVRGRLESLKQRAAGMHMQIDETTNTVRPGPDFRGSLAAAQADMASLQSEMNSIIAQANRVDQELAHAINMADGKDPIPQNLGPRVGKEGLTPSQVASDANQERLRQMRPGLQAKVDQLQRQFDALAATAYVSGSHDPQLWNQINSVGDQLRDAKGRLADVDAIEQAMNRPYETYLTQLTVPDDPHKQLLAAVAVGNPDTAQNVSVTVPGVGSTTRDSLPGMVTEANNLRNEELRQLGLAGKPLSAATIAWMGYTPPPNR